MEFNTSTDVKLPSDNNSTDFFVVPIEMKNLQGFLSELFLGEVQGVIVGSDAVFSPLWAWW